MKKYLIALLALAPLSAAAQSIITGIWENNIPNIGFYKIMDGKTVQLATAIPNEKGEFGFVVFNEGAGFYQIGTAPQGSANNYTFYLKPQDRLSAVFKPNKFVLTGVGNSLENNEMERWQNESESFDYIVSYDRMATYVDFFPVLDELAEKNTTYTVDASVDKTFAKRFADYRKNHLSYGAMRFLYTPHTTHPQDEDMSGFYKNLSLEKLDNSIFEYPKGAMLIHFLKMRAEVEENKSRAAGAPRPSEAESLHKILPLLSTDELKGEMIMLVAQNLKVFDSLQRLQKEFSEEIKKGGVETRFNDLLISKVSLEKGGTAYPFTLKDASGKSHSLSDFKGKVVYLDIWATWCMPCRKEFPYLKTLHEKFSDNENIVFIGISVDAVKDHEKWKKMLVDEAMPGLQLFGGTEGETMISKPYNINSIPRFILIDKEGKIVSANAPRPSSAEIEGVLKSLLQ